MLRKQKRYGVDIHRRSGPVASGSGEVGKFLAFPVVAELLRVRGFDRILDLGSGDGTFLIDQCKRRADVTGYGVDLAPAAVELGQQKVRQQGLEGRLTLLVGDVTDLTSVAPQIHGLHAATSIYVMHELYEGGRELVLTTFRNFKSAFPNVPLIICEVIRHSPEELREKPGGILEIQLFHDLSHQSLLTRDEWKDLFRDAGFTTVQENYLAFARTAVFVVS